jgi:ribosomal protein S18 acetylase RimI-like enzyme
MATVRAAVPADAEEMAHVHVRSWQVAYRGLMPDAVLDGLDERLRAERHREILSGPANGRTALVAEHGDRIVGFAMAGEQHDGPDGSGEIYAIYVDPDHWGTGAGRLLMDTAVAHLTATGPRPVVLWALDGNARADRFYRRYGFVADGATGSHPVAVGPDVPMIRYTLAPGD